ncbi:zinc-binding alcohol dehydrogenase family protein [Aquirufa regiilacus]
MQQWTCTQPGIFELQETEIPHRPHGFSLLRIKAIGICGTDIHAFAGNQPFFQYPRILGHELALEVVESDRFTAGELVTIIPYFNCQTCSACVQGKTNCCENIQVFGVHTDGGMREYIALEDRYILTGNGLTSDELALVEPLSIAAHGVRRGKIQAGEKVLVMGAGPIGLFTILMAKIQGANIDVAEPNPARLAFCEENLSVSSASQTTYQTVIDATGNKAAIESGFAKIAHGGQYILIGLQKEAISFIHPEFHKREATLMSSRNATIADFTYVMDLLRTQQIDVNPFIRHRFDWSTVGAEFQSIHEPERKIIKAIIQGKK